MGLLTAKLSKFVGVMLGKRKQREKHKLKTGKIKRENGKLQECNKVIRAPGARGIEHMTSGRFTARPCWY